MNLAKEQLEQCRKDYMLKFKLALDTSDERIRWIGFHAAWRPIPSMEEIEEVLNNAWYNRPGQRDFSDPVTITLQAKEIRRAFGGQDE